MNANQYRVISDDTSDKVRKALREEDDFTIAWATLPEMEIMLICPPGSKIPEGGTTLLGPDGREYDVFVKER